MSQYPLANRDRELDLFDQMVAGETRERILLLQAAGGIGKTSLVTEFLRRCPSEVPCVPVDLKGGLGLHQVLACICDRLGWQQFRAFAACVERLRGVGATVSAARDRFEHITLSEYDAAAIRDLLRDGFGTDDLYRLCLYHSSLQPIRARLDPLTNLEDMIDVVVEYCLRQELFAELLLAVRGENVRKYQAHYVRIYKVEAAEPQPIPLGGTGTGHAEIEEALRAPDEAGRATRRDALTRALFEDLAARPGRLVFLFDTYEQADPEVQAWLAGSCLACVERAANLVAVVAGRQVPEERLEWAACCQSHRLRELDQPELWQTYAQDIGAALSPEWITGFCDLFGGHPLKMMEALAQYVPGGGRR